MGTFSSKPAISQRLILGARPPPPPSGTFADKVGFYMGFVSCWVYLNYFKERESCRAQEVKNDQGGCFFFGNADQVTPRPAITCMIGEHNRVTFRDYDTTRPITAAYSRSQLVAQ